MTKAHKASNQGGFLLRRKLVVQGLNQGQWDDLIFELNHHPCVDFAEQKSPAHLSVTFDGTRWSTDQLLELVRGYGGCLKDSWWQRRKLAWYRVTDDNVRANAQHQPFCCSKIPPMKK